MKYLLLDGKNVNVGGCKSCPLCTVDYGESGEDTILICKYPDTNLKPEQKYEFDEDHFIEGCPLSPYQSAHHLYVSIKCIYETIKTLYDNFREWWDGRK